MYLIVRVHSSNVWAAIPDYAAIALTEVMRTRRQWILLYDMSGVLVRPLTRVQHGVVCVEPLLLPRWAKNPDNGIMASLNEQR